MKCYLCGAEVGNSLGACQNCREKNDTKRENKIRDLDEAWKRAKSVSTPPGFWLRFLALTIDSNLTNLIFSVIVFCLTTVFGEQINEKIVQYILLTSDPRFANHSSQQAMESLAYTSIILGLLPILSLLAWVLYYVIFEWSSLNATPGKWVLGLDVARKDGEKISFSRALARALSKIISTIPFSVGFILCAFHPQKKSLHDIISGTIVRRTPSQSLDRLILSLFLSLILMAANIALGILIAGNLAKIRHLIS